MSCLRSRVDLVRRLTVARIAHDLGHLLPPLHRSVQADVEVTVVFVVGVKGQADGEAVDFEQGFGLGGLLVVFDGEQSARSGPVFEMLEDEQAGWSLAQG